MINFENKLAVIDIGSNSIRLVVYGPNFTGRVCELANIKVVARLRNYLNEVGYFSIEGMTVLLETLLGFQEILKFQQVNRVKCIATATIRQAVNKIEIVDLVKKKTGFSISVLTEEEEAFYGYYAVIHTTHFEEGITIDIGGGSTEVTYFKRRILVHSHSFPFGVVCLKDKFMKGEKMTVEEEGQMTNYLIEAFNSLSWLKNLQVPIIAIGGSARNIAQIDQNLRNYPIAGTHQYSMKPEDLTKMKEMILPMSVGELEKLEGLSMDRADIILPALATFILLCQYTNTERFVFSSKGLRDGIYYKETLPKERIGGAKHIIEENLSNLESRFDKNPIHASQTSRLAIMLTEQLIKVNILRTDELNIQEIRWAAKIYYLGQFIDSDASSQHTFYLIANSSLNGLDHRMRIRLALIASFKNNSLFKQFLVPFSEWFSKDELGSLRIAGAIVKLAAALDASKRGIVKNLNILESNNGLMIKIFCSNNAFVEKYHGKKEIRHLEKALRKPVKLQFERIRNKNI